MALSLRWSCWLRMPMIDAWSPLSAWNLQAEATVLKQIANAHPMLLHLLVAQQRVEPNNISPSPHMCFHELNSARFPRSSQENQNTLNLCTCENCWHRSASHKRSNNNDDVRNNQMDSLHPKMPTSPDALVVFGEPLQDNAIAFPGPKQNGRRCVSVIRSPLASECLHVWELWKSRPVERWRSWMAVSGVETILGCSERLVLH